MDIVDRLITYRDYTGYSSSQFADKAGIPRPTLSQFLNGRNKRLSDDMTGKLHLAYPDLNIMWLLFGEGNMLNDPNIKISEGKNEDYFDFSYSQETNPEMITSTKYESEKLKQNSSIQQNREEPTSSERDKIVNHAAKDEFSYLDPIQSGYEKAAKKNIHPTSLPTDPEKKIREIVVFYTDNSYEAFRPVSEK